MATPAGCRAVDERRCGRGPKRHATCIFIVIPMATREEGVLTPTATDERMAVLDTVRGFALLGILVANMAFFCQPIAVAMLGWAAPGGALDRAVILLVRLLVEAKFYTLFALLFGIGFGLQLSRAEAARRPAAMAVRTAAGRSGGAGAVAHVPAVVRGHPAQLRGGGDFPAAVSSATAAHDPGVGHPAGVAAHVVPGGDPGCPAPRVGEPGDRPPGRAGRAGRPGMAGLPSRQLRRRGVATRARRPAVRALHPALPAQTVGLFLLGFWLVRRGFLQQLAAQRQRMVRLLAICLPLGLAVNLLLMLARDHRTAGWRLVVALGILVGGPLLSLCYAGVLILLSAENRWRRRLAPLAAAGRMALTNYLLQSLVCTTLFYGYGFGLMGTFGPAAATAVAIALWVVQLFASVFWLRHFRCGPAEWLWRSFIYLRWQPSGERHTAQR